MGINGDDAIELFKSGSVIDVFGNINVDGSGQPWEYLDGWAYRDNGSLPNNGSWDISEWSFSGKNALDGESSNATASSPFPIGSFTSSGGGSSTTQSSDTFSGLTEGTYSISITDANGCVSASQTVDIGSNPIPEISISITDVSCFGGSDGSVSISPSVGDAPFTYFLVNALENALIISGVIDGPLSGGTPKAVELYVIDAISDLSIYGLGSANNGGGTDGQEFTFPAVSVSAGSYITVSYEALQFGNFLGSSPSYTSGSMGINGDDAIELFKSGAVIDVFGNINVDGTGQAWEYLDGWAYRNSGSFTNDGVWDISEWSFSGKNALDGESSNATASSPFPIGSFTTSGSSGGTSQTSNVFTGLSAGSSSVYVEDANGCVSALEDVLISEPDLLVASSSAPQILCIGGMTDVTVSASGGVAPYSGAGTFTVNEGTYDYLITDNNGCTASTTITTTVVPDVTAPTVNCPADAAVNTDSGVCEALISIAAPTSSDNCSVASVINDYNGTSDASDTYPLGTTTVTWTVTDGSGNTANCSMDVTVTDTEDPSIACSADVAVNSDPGVCEALISIDPPTSSDNCSVASVVNDYNGTSDASDTYPLGTTTVTWTVTDGSGNTANSSIDVTVTDNEAPVINCPADVAVNTDAGVCEAMTTIAAPASSDNCSVASVINDYNGTSDASDTYPLGTTTVTWTVTDGSGNTANCSMDVTVTDIEVPVINCPADVAVNTDPGVCEAMTTIAAPASSDNCSVVSVINDYNGTSDASDTYPLGTTTVTWTVTDGSGNTSNCSMDVTVTDAELPVIDCPSDIVLSECTPTASWDLIASDNCGVSSVSSDIPSGSTFAEGTTTTVTITAIDNSGNVANCTFSVTRDPDLTVSATAGPVLCFGDTTIVEVTANGGAPPYTGIGSYSEVAGTYTYVVTDSKGCSESTTITIAEPTPLVADADGCSLVYGGAGIEFGCATIDGAATGGTPGYGYDWSTSETTSSIIVCPDSTSTYTLTVTDANGCITTIDWTVEQVDISCTPGGSSSGSGSHSGSGSGSHSGSGSGSSSGISYASHASGVSCPSGSGSHSGSGSGSHSSHSHSGSGSGSHSSHSGSGSGSSSSCHLSKYSKISHQISDYSSASGSDCKSNSNAGKKDKVLMCFEGETYCVQQKHIQKRLNCGYTLGPCDAQQTAACSNAQVDNDSVSCVCDGKLVSLTVRYIGPSNQDINVTAKKCNVTLLSASNATTGDVFTIDASAAGLDYLRKETYFELAGTDFGPVKIPTNCCDNPVGRFFFPFEVIAWTDTEGNECSSSAAKANGSDRTKPETEIATVEESGPFIQQYPNPADQNATFEFTVTKDQEITVTVMNIRGKVIQTLYSGHAESMMTYRVDYNVSSIESGIYFVHLNTTEGVFKKKFVILR